jgi:hypothetical protein
MQRFLFSRVSTRYTEVPRASSNDIQFSSLREFPERDITVQEVPLAMQLSDRA